MGAHASEFSRASEKETVIFVFSEVDCDNFELHGLQKFSSLKAQVLMMF